MLQRFCEQPDIHRSKHDCCIICHQECNCDDPACSKNTSKQQESTVTSFKRNERFVDKSKKNDLLELLQEYQKKLQSKCPAYLFSSETTTGFSDLLIKFILETCKYIFSIDNIFELNPVFTKQHAKDILCMISDVFEQPLSEMDIVRDEELRHILSYDLEYGGNYMQESDNISSDDGSSVSCDSDMPGVTEM